MEGVTVCTPLSSLEYLQKDMHHVMGRGGRAPVEVKGQIENSLHREFI